MNAFEAKCFELFDEELFQKKMNEDIKVMIRQNEQMMVLGGITLATLVVGAYVILRN